MAEEELRSYKPGLLRQRGSAAPSCAWGRAPAAWAGKGVDAAGQSRYPRGSRMAGEWGQRFCSGLVTQRQL